MDRGLLGVCAPQCRARRTYLGRTACAAGARGGQRLFRFRTLPEVRPVSESPRHVPLLHGFEVLAGDRLPQPLPLRRHRRRREPWPAKPLADSRHAHIRLCRRSLRSAKRACLQGTVYGAALAGVSERRAPFRRPVGQALADGSPGHGVQRHARVEHDGARDHRLRRDGSPRRLAAPDLARSHARRRDGARRRVGLRLAERRAHPDLLLHVLLDELHAYPWRVLAAGLDHGAGHRRVSHEA